MANPKSAGDPRNSAVHARCFNSDSFSPNERRKHWVVGCVVVSFHVWILSLIANVSPRWGLPRDTPSSLVLLDLSKVPAVPKLTIGSVAQLRSKRLPDSGGDERSGQNDAAKRRESGQSLQAPQRDPTLIGWSDELGTVAKAEAPQLLAERRRKCHDAEMHGELLTGCGKVKSPDMWKPPFNAAGLFAVGKRLANGHIFGTMRDPDRDRSSVPDIAELQKGPHRPVPLAVNPRLEDFTQ